MSIQTMFKELSGIIAGVENLLPAIPDSIMELHNAIEEVIGNEDEITLNGEEYTLVPTDEIERLRRIHRKCQEIRKLMYSA